MSEEQHVEEFKISRSNDRADDYGEVPVLFPQFYRLGPKSRRDYVAKRLVEMVRTNTLYLTDVFQQPTRVKDEVGQILLGHRVVDHNFRAGVRVPQELLDHRVRVRSLDGSSVRWCRDMVEGDPIKGRRKGTGAYQTGPDGDAPTQHYRVAEEWVDTEKSDVMLRLPDAWICLRMAGAYCVPAKRHAIRKSRWRFEEVRPEPKAAPEPPAEPTPTPERKPGRKSFAEANG